MPTTGSPARPPTSSARLALPWALAAGLVAALLFALAFPGRPCFFLGWVAFAPLLWALHRCAPARALLVAFGFGFLIWLSSIWWVVIPLHDITRLTWAGATALLVVACALFAVPYALGGWLCAAWRVRPGALRAARDAGLFAVANHYFPLVFPGNVAHSQFRHPVMFQVLDLGGVPLLAFLMVLVGALLAETLPEDGGGRPVRVASAVVHARLRPLLAAVGVLAVVVGYGRLRLAQCAADEAAGRGAWLTVGAIQANLPIAVPPERQPSPGAYENELSTALERARELCRRRPDVELLAFPEWPERLIFAADDEGEKTITAFAATVGRPVIINGMLLGRPTPEGDERRTSVLAFIDGEGRVRDLYRKIVLVPGTEYWPWEERWPGWLRRLIPPSLAIVRGERPTVFPVKPRVAVIPLICYEGILSRHVRRFVALGGNLIVNGSNDTWFGRTPASTVHLAVALYRSVEFRVPYVRVANSGISVFVDASGRILPGSEMPQFETAEGVFPVFAPDRRSPYARWGDAFAVSLTVLLAGALASHLLRTPGRSRGRA